MQRYRWILVVGVAFSACARQSDVNRLELQIRRYREETARADSARAVALDQLIALQRRTIDSLTRLLALQETRMVGFRGDVRADLTELQRQLVQVQELTGQSQQRLTELRGQIDARSSALAAAARADTTGASPISTGPGPEQLYELSIQQLRRGSPATARIGFLKLIQDYPAHERAADAQFFVGETWGDRTGPDSAAAAYDRMVINYPNSSRVPTALYRLGVIAEQKRDRAAARQYYNRLIAGYPRSEEAALAREKLQALGR